MHIDSNDDADGQARMSPPDTDNDDGMVDISDARVRMVRFDANNDVEFNGDNAAVEDDMIDND